HVADGLPAVLWRRTWPGRTFVYTEARSQREQRRVPVIARSRGRRLPSSASRVAPVTGPDLDDLQTARQSTTARVATTGRTRRRGTQRSGSRFGRWHRGHPLLEVRLRELDPGLCRR